MNQKRVKRLVKKKNLKNFFSGLQETLLSIFVFLLPTQLGYHFWPRYSHVFGVKVDYLAPTIYLNDLVLFLIFLLWLVEKFFFLKKGGVKSSRILGNFKFAGVVFLLVFINILGSGVYQLSLLKWLKILEMFLFAVYLSKKQPFSFKKEVVYPLVFSGIFFGFIGVFQFIFQKTLGGPFYFLGERSFNTSTPGIALFSLGGRDYLRVYSTFSHPNALGGYFVVVLSLVLPFLIEEKKALSKWSRFVFSLFVATAVICIFLSFSRVAILSFFFFFVLFFLRHSFSKKSLCVFSIIYLLFCFLQFIFLDFFTKNNWLLERSLSERAYLLISSKKMISENIFFGVGLNNFIPQLGKMPFSFKHFWTLQPVHNIILLVFSEGGLFAFLFLGTLFLKAIASCFHSGKKRFLAISVFLILLTGFFDHYWLTLQQNMFLMALIFGLTFRKKLT